MGYDLDNMNKEELIQILINTGYLKLLYEIPNHENFEVGKYYLINQTGNDQLEVYDKNKCIILTFKEANTYFK